MSKILAASAGLALAAAALANPNMTIGGGAGFAIPDNSPGGASSSINTAMTGFQVVGVQFTGLAHTWAGDLSMTLTGPGAGNSFNFYFRPGQTASSADVGQNGDFLVGNSYSFVDGGAAWNTGATIPSGAYAPIRSPFAPAQANGSFSALAGGAGTWTLNISDNAALDTGSIQGWSLIVKAVPAPASAALFGLAGIAGIRRRR